MRQKIKTISESDCLRSAKKRMTKKINYNIHTILDAVYLSLLII
ncbi:hypothetical protein [Candidatus Hartigia pinicola]